MFEHDWKKKPDKQKKKKAEKAEESKSPSLRYNFVGSKKRS